MNLEIWHVVRVDSPFFGNHIFVLQWRGSRRDASMTVEVIVGTLDCLGLDLIVLCE